MMSTYCNDLRHVQKSFVALVGDDCVVFELLCLCGRAFQTLFILWGSELPFENEGAEHEKSIGVGGPLEMEGT